MPRWSRVLILLSVALVALNAQCFANCLTQPGGEAVTHCHQHGNAKSAHCSQQHDLSTSSARSAVPVDGFIALAELPDLAIDFTSRAGVELLAPSPPALLGLATYIPLRV